jgi:hypothetical protein
MTQKELKFTLSDSQKRKLARAYTNKTSTTLRLSKDNLHASGITLLLTQNEIKKLNDGKNT